MLSRARVLATVTLLIGCLAGPAAWAQVQNLEAGKSASQLFAGTCSACHKSPRGLLKTVSPGALTGFLREHYTTSGDMASQLSAYLVSNGAGDSSRQSRQGADAKQGPGGDQQGRRQHGAAGQETARPDADATSREAGPSGRRRQARPVETPEEGKPTPNGPGQAAIERDPDGRKLKRLGRRGRPEELPAGSEPPKAESGSGMNDQAKGDSAAGDVNAKPEVSKPGEAKPSDVKPAEAKSEPVKSEPAKSEPVKSEAKSEPVQAEPSKDMSTGEPQPVVRRDQVPAVTPAPSAAAAPLPAAAPDGSSATPAPAASAPAASASTAVPSPPAAVTPPAAPTAVTASAPPAAPSSSSGPPVPPISR